MAIEHNYPLFTLFVDLKKTYDSVPCHALCLVLSKLGIPPGNGMLSLIQSWHDCMMAAVKAGQVQCNNGMWQGCSLVPMLFNLYFAVVVSSLRLGDPGAGEPVHARVVRKLASDRSAKSLDPRQTSLFMSSRMPRSQRTRQLPMSESQALTGMSR